MHDGNRRPGVVSVLQHYVTPLNVWAWVLTAAKPFLVCGTVLARQKRTIRRRLADMRRRPSASGVGDVMKGSIHLSRTPVGI